MIITSPSTFSTLSSRMRTLRQLYRLHAIAITNGLISSHPHLTLPKLLYPFTLLLAGPTSSPPPWTAYVSSLFNSIDEPSSFGYNTGVRAPRFSPPPLAPSTFGRYCFCPSTVRRDAGERFSDLGHSHCGIRAVEDVQEAIELFCRTMETQLRPDNVALVSTLSACAQLGEMDIGGIIHDYIVRNHIPVNPFLCTGLVDFYAKCGSLQTAIQVFKANPGGRNLLTCNAMIIGLAMLGQGRRLLAYFSRMVDSGVEPDGVPVLGVLVGCSHSGLVTEVCQISDEMESAYGVTREPKHYGCLMDLFGRVGLVKEAMDLVRKVLENEDIFIWGGLLGGCRKYGNVEVAEAAAKKVMDLYPEDGEVYSIMAGVYAGADQWDDVVRTRASMSAGPAKRK
ncbi:hypothetical protein CRG98_000067, partial [Punica granatum]